MEMSAPRLRCRLLLRPPWLVRFARAAAPGLTRGHVPSPRHSFVFRRVKMCPQQHACSTALHGAGVRGRAVLREGRGTGVLVKYMRQSLACGVMTMERMRPGPRCIRSVAHAKWPWWLGRLAMRE